MEIKHSHPSYPSEEAHMTQLKDIRRICLALLQEEQKKQSGKESA